MTCGCHKDVYFSCSVSTCFTVIYFLPIFPAAGNIDPKDFETVVLALIKELDDDLWMSRLEEKQFLFWEAEAKKKKLDAERERLEQGGS